jgi:hypothetical protein
LIQLFAIRRSTIHRSPIAVSSDRHYHSPLSPIGEAQRREACRIVKYNQEAEP